ncbi:10033_t:CDS:2 [Funneliformis mosseae]|uniref:10033_t:CDS:1 n=1 Tax=Funneliformis mosseae TaxID=27381 RepID=A0A9N8UY84_FUNMO|nr:10033_t:CDS:2 [Funneliformis mosseae]
MQDEGRKEDDRHHLSMEPFKMEINCPTANLDRYMNTIKDTIASFKPIVYPEIVSNNS